MIEFIPSAKVSQRLSEGWTMVSHKPGDYAALMAPPAGWEPVVSIGEVISRLYEKDGKLTGFDGKPPFKRKAVRFSTCTMPGCEGKHFARGLCQKHYTRVRTHGSARIVCAPGPAAAGKCKEKGCRKKSCARGMCNLHYRRVLMSERRELEAA